MAHDPQQVSFHPAMFEPSQQQPASTSFTSNPVHVSSDKNYFADIIQRLDALENKLDNAIQRFDSLDRN
eukprot:6986497-Karenia_brevis.AAC.1